MIHSISCGEPKQPPPPIPNRSQRLCSAEFEWRGARDHGQPAHRESDAGAKREVEERGVEEEEKQVASRRGSEEEAESGVGCACVLFVSVLCQV